MKKVFLSVMVSTVLFSNIAFAETANLLDQVVVLEQNNVLTVEQKQPLIDLPNEVETKRNLFCVNS
jgi:ABC-type Na+ transport system ATPase subunit NatA